MPHPFSLSLIQKSQLAVKSIQSKLLKREPELFDKKWLDYRFMHPSDATQLFADVYKVVAKELCREFFGAGRAAKNDYVSQQHYFDNPSRRRTSLWQARQCADELGMPYEPYINLVIISFIERKKGRRIPSPNQLYNKIDLECARADFDKYTMMELEHATTTHYLNRHFKNHPYQLAHHEWLLRHLSGPEYSIDKLASLVFEKHLLADAQVAKAFGYRAVLQVRERAKEIGLTTAKPSEEETDIDFSPGCLGLPKSYSCKRPQCQRCTYSDTCRQMVIKVEDELIRLYGTSDPLKAEANRKNAARQQTHRDKHKS